MNEYKITKDKYAVSYYCEDFHEYTWTEVLSDMAALLIGSGYSSEFLTALVESDYEKIAELLE